MRGSIGDSMNKPKKSFSRMLSPAQTELSKSRPRAFRSIVTSSVEPSRRVTLASAARPAELAGFFFVGVSACGGGDLAPVSPGIVTDNYFPSDYFLNFEFNFSEKDK